jgi:hypothetical protein
MNVCKLFFDLFLLACFCEFFVRQSVYQLITSPPTPSAYGIIGLAKIGPQNPPGKGVRGQNPPNKGVAARVFAGAVLFASAGFTASAGAIMREKRSGAQGYMSQWAVDFWVGFRESILGSTECAI